MAAWMPFLALVLLASAVQACPSTCEVGCYGPDCMCTLDGLCVPTNADPIEPTLPECIDSEPCIHQGSSLA